MNLPDFCLSSQFFLFFSNFPPLFGKFFAVRGGTLPPLPPQWLRHCLGKLSWTFINILLLCILMIKKTQIMRGKSTKIEKLVGLCMDLK